MRWTGLDSRLIRGAQGAVDMALAYGLHPRITSIRRNWAEQTELRNNYERGLSRFPANLPGDSPHQYGVAWDSVVPDSELETWNAIRAHFGWKLYPHDPVHAELPNWREYRHLLRLT